MSFGYPVAGSEILSFIKTKLTDWEDPLKKKKKRRLPLLYGGDEVSEQEKLSLGQSYGIRDKQ